MVAGWDTFAGSRLAEGWDVSVKTDTRLTSGRRLTRGLGYTLLGPVDITRGTVGLGVEGAQAAAGRLRRGHVKDQISSGLEAAQETIAQELAAVQGVAAAIPQAYAKVRKPKHRARGWLIVVMGVLVLAGGAVAFSIARRSMQPDPSPRPPSVEVDPKP